MCPYSLSFQCSPKRILYDVRVENIQKPFPPHPQQPASAGLVGNGMQASYNASKHGVIGLVRSMAIDHAPDNIRVNSICPGLIKTKFSEALWSDEKIMQRFLKQIPLGRAGTTDDIAGLAVFLASDAAAYCTGSVYMVDGGYSTH